MTRLLTNKLSLAVLFSATSIGALAGDFSTYGSFGTQGIGAGVSIPLSDRSAVRLEMNGLNYEKDFAEDALDYEGRIKNKSISALYDWHVVPDSPFRITAGLVFNDGGIEATGTSNTAGSITIGGTTVPNMAGEHVKANADFNKISPYIGVGWSKTPKKQKGFSFFGDIGAFYAKPSVSLEMSPGLRNAVNAADPDAIGRETGKIQDRADKLKWYPVLRVGVRYTFD